MELEMIVILNIFVSGMNKKFEGYRLAWEFRLGCGTKRIGWRGCFGILMGLGWKRIELLDCVLKVN